MQLVHCVAVSLVSKLYWNYVVACHYWKLLTLGKVSGCVATLLFRFVEALNVITCHCGSNSNTNFLNFHSAHCHRHSVKKASPNHHCMINATWGNSGQLCLVVKFTSPPKKTPAARKTCSQHNVCLSTDFAASPASVPCVRLLLSADNCVFHAYNHCYRLIFYFDYFDPQL